MGDPIVIYMLQTSNLGFQSDFLQQSGIVKWSPKSDISIPCVYWFFLNIINSRTVEDWYSSLSSALVSHNSSVIQLCVILLQLECQHVTIIEANER